MNTTPDVYIKKYVMYKNDKLKKKVFFMKKLVFRGSSDYYYRRILEILKHFCCSKLVLSFTQYILRLEMKFVCLILSTFSTGNLARCLIFNAK